MSEGVKQVDVRLGSFACSIRGFDEPGPVLAAVLAAVRDLLEAGPAPEGAPEELDDVVAELLLEEAAAASGLPAEELEVARGLLVTARPAAASKAAEDAASEEALATEEERAAPRLDAEASAEIKRVLEQAARLPSAPTDAAAFAARSHFGKRARDLDLPAPEEPVFEEEPLSAEAEAPAEETPVAIHEPEVAEETALASEPELAAEPEPEPAPDPKPATATEVEPEPETATEVAPEPAAEAETVREPEEEPLLLNIFDAPPPRPARPEPVADTAASGPGLSEPQAAPWRISTDQQAAADERPAAPVDVEETANEPVAIGAAKAQRQGGFFGRGAQQPSNDPAPVSLLRPLGKAASPRQEDKPVPPAPADGGGAPPSVQALAWRMGARTAEERILCVAAWLTFAKGSPKFLRSAAFEQLDAVETESERDVDSRLDAFRSLLRDGSLVQLGTESYAMSERQLDRAAPYFD